MTKRLLYFSPVFWSSYKQRPHFFIEYFLKKNYEVVWVEPYPSRLPKVHDVFRRTNLFDQKTPLPEQLTVIKLTTLPIEPLIFLNKLNLVLSSKHLQWLCSWLPENGVLGIGKPSLIANAVLKAHRGFSFYDAMDDLPAFHRGIAKRHLKKLEKDICGQVTEIFVSSTSLAHKFSQNKVRVTKILNAFDASHFPAYAPSLTKVATPIIGYIGTIADWFDWDLVIKIGNKFPWCAIELVGPVFTRFPRHLPSNIKLLKPIAHSEVSQCLARFSLGLIPFKLNELTKSVDPIKYYEYEVMGLPIVSTAFGEMLYCTDKSEVFLISECNYVIQIKNALEYVGCPERIIKFSQDNTWNKRLDILGSFGL